MQKNKYQSPEAELLELSTELGICQVSGQIEDMEVVPGPFSASIHFGGQL